MDRLEIIETLKHLPNLLEAELAGVPENVLRRRSAETEWSIKETVGHLRDDSLAWSRRLYQVWSQNDPVFTPYDGEVMVRDGSYQDAELRSLLAEIGTYRLRMVDVLAHAVDWTRLGQQPGVGRRTLMQFAEGRLSHDADHLAQIRQLKAEAQAPAG